MDWCNLKSYDSEPNVSTSGLQHSGIDSNFIKGDQKQLNDFFKTITN